MDTNKILSADLLDLIFDDRNKDYGAYELRKTYQRRVVKSLIFTGLFVALTCTGVVLANKLEPKHTGGFDIITLSLQNIEPEPKPPEPLPEPPPQHEPPQTRTEPLTNIVVGPDEIVDNPIPTQDDLDSALIGTKKVDGPANIGIAQPAALTEGVSKGIIEENPTPKPEFIPIEVEARFDGDWAKFLFKHLDPQVAINNGAPNGNYTVVLQFVVDIDGSVSEIKALTNHGYGLEEEAIRVIKKAKKWEPAIQNGRKVKAYRKQPITFQVTEG